MGGGWQDRINDTFVCTVDVTGCNHYNIFMAKGVTAAASGDSYEGDSPLRSCWWQKEANKVQVNEIQ